MTGEQVSYVDRQKCLNAGWSHRSEKPKHNVNPMPRGERNCANDWEFGQSGANSRPILDQPEESANPSANSPIPDPPSFFDRSLNLRNGPQYNANPAPIGKHLPSLSNPASIHGRPSVGCLSHSANLMTLLLIHHHSATQPTINDLGNGLTHRRTPVASRTTHRRASDIPPRTSQS